MKILLVIDQFYSANNGMTISARRFAKILSDHGHEVRVASTGAQGDTPYLMKVYHIPVFDKLVTSQGMSFAIPDDKLLYNAVSWADVVHLLVPFALSRRAIEIADELGVPYTAAFHVQPENITSSIHLSQATLVNDAIYKWFDHYIYRRCGHIHCPSKFIADELEKHGYSSKLHVISNGIDPDFKYRKIPKTADFAGKFVILTIGRLSVEKRQDVLIRAVAKSEFRDNIQVVIAGQGPRKPHLEKLAEELGVPVLFKFFTKPELLDMIAMSDLYVHPAEAEIEAMSCMEAFAGGLVPIISNSQKSATPQFALDNRSLFDCGDSSDLASKIDYWYNHTEQRREMEHKYAASAEKYNLDACVKKAEEMFAEAICDRERRDEYEFAEQF